MLSVSMPLARPLMTFLVPYMLVALEPLVPLIDAILIHSLHEITSGSRPLPGMDRSGRRTKFFYNSSMFFYRHIV